MRTTITILLCLALVAPVLADNNRTGRADVRSEFFKDIAGLNINTVNVVSQAAGGSTTYTLALPVYNSEVQAIDYKTTAADAAASITLTVQRRNLWGNWVSTSEVVTLTGATAYEGAEALSIPVCGEIRVAVSCDATYATTVEALALSRW